jgi:hypothetical protein
MSERSTTVVSADLPKDLVSWLDLHLAKLRVATLESGRQDAPIPTRSSIIRDLLLKLRSSHNGNHKK